MKRFYIFSLTFMFVSLINLEAQKPDRLTFVQSFYPEYTNYIFNAEEDYVKHGFFEKDEEIKFSGQYSYKWANQDKNNYINLSQFLPEPDQNGYRDFNIYDSLYINIYSKEKTSSTFIIALNCQERQPDSKSSSKNAYLSYYVTMNFKGWKQFKIPFTEFTKNYSPDIRKVTSLCFHAKGWSQVPDPTSVLYIDKFFFTKAIYDFNMNENDINEQTYSDIIKRMIYTMTYKTFDQVKIVTDRAKALTRDAKSNHDKMNKNGLPYDFQMNQSSHMSKIYGNIRAIAIGYATEGGDLYKNEQILQDIISALDYMHENYYSRREENIFSNDNWWDWEIGTPENLLEALVCIADDISQKLIDKYLEPINRYDPYPSMTMSNRINIAYCSIISAVLQKDYKRIAISIEMFRECFDTVEKLDGFYDDGSFIQHNYISYLGEYGVEMMTPLTILSYSLDESVFRLDDEMKQYQFNWIKNSFLPAIYKGGFMDLVRGRSISRDIRGDQSGKMIINAMCLMLDYLINDEDINYLKTILKYFYEINKRYLMYSATPASLIKLEEFENDENIPAKKIDDFAKIFSRIDKAISQVNDVGIGISMSSSRSGKYESINGENKKGWYTGDGMTYIYLNVNDYGSNYWKNINYYRLQGTTVTIAKREEKNFSGLNTLTKYDFVGGAYSNYNMVAAMQFGSESPNIGFTSTLVGNKGYFVFGEKLICLGNSINSTDAYEVETIIENRNLTGKVYAGDNEIKDKTGRVNSNYLYIENYGGIYLPKYEKVKYNITNNNFIEIYFEYGKIIQNEEYSYMIFPNMNKNDFNEYINNIEIISNNNMVSAVKNKELNSLEIIFWKNGQLGDIKVDNPCAIIIEEDYIYVSEPAHKFEFINLSIGDKNYQVEVNKGYTTKVKKSK